MIECNALIKETKLGSEDNGLPKSITDQCQTTISLLHASDRPSSFNVAIAGSIVMYDRIIA